MLRHSVPIALLLCLALAPQRAAADSPQLRVLPLAELRFGTFAVPDVGSIEVSPSGAVQRQGIVSVTSGDTGAARFSVRYDRGNNGRQRLNLLIQLTVSAPTSFVQGGVTASLSRFQTDLPGYATIAPNQIIEIRMPNCTQRVCETSFNLGGRLDIDRRFGGAAVAVPIPVDAVLVSVK